MFYASHCSLRDSGVDSAEADKVGSQGIRFCAYEGLICDEGVRHYRTTPARCDYPFICGLAHPVSSSTCTIPVLLIRASIPRAFTRSRWAQYNASPS